MAKKAKKKKNKLACAGCPACGWNGANAAGAANAGNRGGLFGNLPSWIPGTPAQQQFIVGLALGAGAAWVLGDEDRRAALLKTAMKLYSGLSGGFEELKEQAADIRAEMDAQLHQDP